MTNLKLQLKLQYEDDLEYQQKFVDDMEEILKDIRQLKEINTMLGESVENQTPNLQQIEYAMLQSESNLELANLELSKAETYQDKANFKKGLVLVLGVAAISTPVGLLLGLKIGLSTGLLGLVTGSSAMLFKK